MSPARKRISINSAHKPYVLKFFQPLRWNSEDARKFLCEVVKAFLETVLVIRKQLKNQSLASGMSFQHCIERMSERLNFAVAHIALKFLGEKIHTPKP